MDVHLAAEGLNINFPGAQDLKTSKKYEYFPDGNLIHGNAIVNRYFSPAQADADPADVPGPTGEIPRRKKKGFRRFGGTLPIAQGS